MINKEELDKILVLHKAQPVGTGYIDVIVKQEYAHQLIKTIILSGIQITRITWWEYVDKIGTRGKYGMGGPQSEYYDGWFSEICFGEDEISSNAESEIIKIIENKEIAFFDGVIIKYKQEERLTPALWLNVPNEWTHS